MNDSDVRRTFSSIAWIYIRYACFADGNRLSRHARGDPKVDKFIRRAAIFVNFWFDLQTKIGLRNVMDFFHENNARKKYDVVFIKCEYFNL